LNPNYLGCYGNHTVKSPVIDRISQQSTIFTECHTAINLTTPSHASMITGVLPSVHGVYENARPVSTDFKTVSELFSENGFDTMASVSSLQLNPEYSNLGQGFNLFITAGKPGISGEITVNRAIRWFSEASNENLFAWIHLFDCHAPYNPPLIYRHMYIDEPAWFSYPKNQPKRLKSIDKEHHASPALVDTRAFLKREPFNRWFSEWLGDTADETYAVKLYLGAVSFTDRQLELFFNALSQKGIWDRSTVLITSDHGESFGEHQIYYDHWGPYEQSIDVPLIIKKAYNADRSIDTTLASTLDVPPTLLAQCNIKIPDSYMGVSLVKKSEPSNKLKKRMIFTEHTRNVAVTVRDSQYKLIMPKTRQDFYPESIEMYDISRDLSEVDNIIDKNPEIADQLTEALDGLMYEISHIQKPEVPCSPDNSVTDQLKSLGYLD
ncbi:sulfatase, partial [bacterium]|nr:sulfatase [candidate division CSSED10-310 bacterium]